jgi:alkylhydroperoxidase family enzyme
MLKSVARAMLAQFRKHYDYDVRYMEAMLEASPKAFFKFAKLMEAAQHRESAPKEAYYAAKLVGALTEDCGPCTQLVVDLAREAGVADDQIEAVLLRKRELMSADTALGFRFAQAVARRELHADEVREAVRIEWGDKGVVDLTFALQLGRMFPMVKAGLGYAEECRRITIDGRNVSVARLAA